MASRVTMASDDVTSPADGRPLVAACLGVEWDTFVFKRYTALKVRVHDDHVNEARKHHCHEPCHVHQCVFGGEVVPVGWK